MYNSSNFIKCTNKRPANGVLNAPWSMETGIDFPQFLENDAIRLRFTVFAKAEALEELFCQTAMTALGKDRASGVQLHTPCKGLLKTKHTLSSQSIKKLIRVP